MTGRRAGTVARYLLSAAAIAIVGLFLYRQRHLFTGFRSAAAHAHWYWILLAFAAEVASMLPLAQAQRILLREARIETPLGEMTAVTFASNAIASSVPGGAAVAEGYAFKRYKHFGASDGEAGWAELASGAIAFAALAAIALAGAVVDSAHAAAVVLPVVSVVFAGSTAAAALFRRPELLCEVVDALDSRVPRRSKRTRVATRLREIADEIDEIHPSLRTWCAAYAYSAVNWLLDVVCLGFAFIAFGAPVPWGAILLAFAGTKVVSSIGVTPGGLGIVEGGMVATFVAYHVEGAVAAAAVVVYRALTLVGLVGVGWAFLLFLSAQGRHPHEHTPRR